MSTENKALEQQLEFRIHKLETQKADQTLQTEEKFKQLSAEKFNIIAEKKNVSDANSQLSYNHRILSMKHDRLEDKLYCFEFDQERLEYKL